MKIDDSSLTPDGPTDPFSVGQKKEAVADLGDPGKKVIKQSKKKRTKSPKSSMALSKKLSPSMVTAEKVAYLDSFGFLDGISEPAVKGFDHPEPVYPPTVYPGVIVTGYKGDPALNKREPWAFDGSFLVFRWLFQLVPEFDKYLKNHALTKDGEGKDLTPEEGSNLLGARMVGRWKSGASIVRTPWNEDEKIDNDFKFEQGENPQFKCPFAAHIRKTNPRNDIEDPDVNRIMRRGIPFGPEVNQRNLKRH